MARTPIADVFTAAANKARELLGDPDQPAHDRADYAAHRARIQAVCRELEELSKSLSLPPRYREANKG